MSELLTPTARRLVRELRAEAQAWNDRATTDDDENPFVRARAEARRDQLDAIVQRLTRELPDVEREAFEVETSESARIDALLEGVA